MVQIKRKILEIEWLPPALFSFDVFVLLAAVFIVTRINYSRKVNTTKLSMLPYYIILAYLAFEMMELLLLIREINTFKSDDTSR